MDTQTLIPTSMLIIALGFALGMPSPAGAQDAAQDSAYVPGAYRVFDGSGSPATLDDVTAAMAGHEVVFVGETHDDPTGHMLEGELLRRAHEAYASRGVVLSLEFFERDIQPVVDEYLAGLITESAFRWDSRPWPG